MTRTRQLATAALVVALTATACGGSEAPRQPDGLPTGPVGAAPVYQPSDKRGGTLELLQPGDCDSWDPQRTYFTTCWNLQRFFSRGLLTFASEPGDRGAKVVPDLATEVATSPDLRTWTYRLKDGIRYEDGTPITSKDVKHGIERVFARVQGPNGPTYVVDELLGGRQFKGPYEDKAGLASIETPDDKTITFRLARPFADWNYVMALPTSTPVPAAKDTREKYGQRPLSSGPYKFAKYTPDQELLLVRNDQWDPKTDQVRRALPDQVRLRMTFTPPDIDQRIASNQADVDTRGVGLEAAVQSRVLTDPRLRERAANPVQPGLRYLSVLPQTKPFDNVHCRNAVAWVVDKEGQQRARGGAVGGGEKATSFSPPGLAYRQDVTPFSSPELRGDVAKAKEELAKCGQPNGFATKIAARNRGKEVKQAEALQRDLAKIGIKATLDLVDGSTYDQTVVVPASLRAKGWGITFHAFVPDWAAPYGLFHFTVDGRQINDDYNQNYGELNDPAINGAMDAALAATDEARRAAKWQEVDRRVLESAVYVPLLYDKALLLHSERLTNAFPTNGYGGQLDLVALGVTP